MEKGSLKIVLAIFITIAVIAGIAYLIFNKTVDTMEKKAKADAIGGVFHTLTGGLVGGNR
jgi:hypothetical protein